MIEGDWVGYTTMKSIWTMPLGTTRKKFFYTLETSQICLQISRICTPHHHLRCQT